MDPGHSPSEAPSLSETPTNRDHPTSNLSPTKTRCVSYEGPRTWHRKRGQTPFKRLYTQPLPSTPHWQPRTIRAPCHTFRLPGSRTSRHIRVGCIIHPTTQRYVFAYGNRI